MKKLKLLDTFSGIGGFSYAAEKLVGGFETTQFIEIDPYCQKVLKKHWPNVPIHDDITTYKPEPYSADVICGGFPCTDISVAGRQEGITEATRSGLFFQLITTIRMVRPKYVILENVSAILANGMDIVLGELYKAGYDAEWCCIPSSFVGACHQRDRWWLIAYPIGFRSKSQSKIQTGGDSSSRSVGSRNIQLSTSNTESLGHGRGDDKGCEIQERQFLSGEQKGREIWDQTERCGINSANTKGSDWDGDETQQGDGKPRTQEISRDRNSSQSSHTWRSTEHRLNPNWKQYVSQPTICRGNDGLRNRVDRLKALGNSVVPQVAAIPLQRVKDIHNQLTSVDR